MCVFVQRLGGYTDKYGGQVQQVRSFTGDRSCDHHVTVM